MASFQALVQQVADPRLRQGLWECFNNLAEEYAAKAAKADESAAEVQRLRQFVERVAGLSAAILEDAMAVPEQQLLQPLPPPQHQALQPVPPPQHQALQLVPPPQQHALQPVPPPQQHALQPVPPPQHQAPQPLLLQEGAQEQSRWAVGECLQLSFLLPPPFGIAYNKLHNAYQMLDAWLPCRV